MIGKLQEKAINLKSRFKDIGLKMPETPVPVFPIVFDDTRKDERLKNKLFENGIYPSFIKYPGAPSGGLFRFIITSSTTEDQIVLLFETIKSTLEENEMDS
jgi:7-keto-8-aminopelargonate synthetase-like enzyme